MNRSLNISLPMAAAVAIFTLAGHVGLFRILGYLPAVEYSALFLCVLSQTIAISCALVVFAGCFTERWSAAAAWSLVSVLASFFLWDNLSYRWVGLHLDDTIPLLYWSTITSFRAMERKRSAVWMGIGGITAGTVVLILALAKAHGTRFFRPIPVAPFAKIGLSSLLVLALVEVSFPKTVSEGTRERRRRILPLLPLLIPAKSSLVTHRAKFQLEMPNPAQASMVIRALNPPTAAKRPDVYLFVLESFRGDHVTPEVTPNLVAFGAEALGTAHGTASSNCTHLSWYSIFHSRLPIFWSAIAHQADHPYQSLPIAAFRQAGYQIKVFATPSLNYYAIGETLFGPNRALASEISDQKTHLGKGLNTIAAIDRHVMDQTLATLDETGPPTLHLVFLDSTHHDYFWGDRFAPPFKPFLPLTSLLTVRLDENGIGLLRNRYKNAAAYLDSLMGEFFAKMKSGGRESIVAITSDHGEELFEAGHLTHASELNRYQLEVPILIRLPGRKAADAGPTKVASHLDLFPTLLDAVGMYAPIAPLLDGRSLLREEPEPSAIAAQCSNYTPYLYLVDAGEHKALIEFESIAKFDSRIIGRDAAVTHHYDASFNDVQPGLPLHPSLFKGMSKLTPGWERVMPSN